MGKGKRAFLVQSQTPMRPPLYRICKQFVVESGHMLSKHPEKCRFPHGHTRTIEVVVAGPKLDPNDMLLDFKALKLAVQDFIERYDHRMMIHAADPLRESLESVHPDSVLVYEQDPTTEVMAKEIFDYISGVLAQGWSQGPYEINAESVTLERIRVWETKTSWAEFGI